jgi:hypothetical protein
LEHLRPLRGRKKSEGISILEGEKIERIRASLGEEKACPEYNRRACPECNRRALKLILQSDSECTLWHGVESGCATR